MTEYVIVCFTLGFITGMLTGAFIVWTGYKIKKGRGDAGKPS